MRAGSGAPRCRGDPGAAGSVFSSCPSRGEQAGAAPALQSARWPPEAAAGRGWLPMTPNGCSPPKCRSQSPGLAGPTSPFFLTQRPKQPRAGRRAPKGGGGVKGGRGRPPHAPHTARRQRRAGGTRSLAATRAGSTWAAGARAGARQQPRGGAPYRGGLTGTGREPQRRAALQRRRASWRLGSG